MVLCLTGIANAQTVPYLDANGSSQSATATALTGSETALSSGWYIIPNTVSNYAARITVTGDVHLILADGCNVAIDDGIGVDSGNSLTIYAQSAGADMGALRVFSITDFDAGIGGTGENGECGTITINGGAVRATSGVWGAAIGGGWKGGGGTVVINGGTVTATGGVNGMAIGHGHGGSGGTVRVNGSYNYWTNTVTASPGGVPAQGNFTNNTATFAPGNNFGYIRLMRIAGTLAGTVTITGTPTVGQRLEAATTGITSPAPLGTLYYQWKRNGANITVNGTDLTYRLTAADVGRTITVTVIAENYGGSLTSAATAAVEAAPSISVIITGSPRTVKIPSSGSTVDLSAVAGLFTVSAAGAGVRTYTIESGGSGSGSISGNILTVTEIGTFNISLATAATATHEAGAKATAMLTVEHHISGNIIDLSDPNPPASGIGWAYNNIFSEYSIDDNADVLVTGSNAGNGRSLNVNSATATITLQNATITGLGDNVRALDISGNANLTMILDGTNTLTAGTDAPGISVAYGSKLTITGTGSLAVTGKGYWAGISTADANCAVSINGGTVTATSGHLSMEALGSAVYPGTVTANGTFDYWTNTSNTALGAQSGSGLFANIHDWSYVKLVWTGPPTFQAPNFIRHPSDQNALEGFGTHISAAVAGYPLPAYQWQVSTDGGITWNDIPADYSGYRNATTAVLTTPILTTHFNGFLYRCVASNSVGETVSNSMRLSVVYSGDGGGGGGGGFGHVPATALSDITSSILLMMIFGVVSVVLWGYVFLGRKVIKVNNA